VRKTIASFLLNLLFNDAVSTETVQHCKIGSLINMEWLVE
jgi:hypothetical protein